MTSRGQRRYVFELFPKLFSSLIFNADKQDHLLELWGWRQPYVESCTLNDGADPGSHGTRRARLNGKFRYYEHRKHCDADKPNGHSSCASQQHGRSALGYEDT